MCRDLCEITQRMSITFYSSVAVWSGSAEKTVPPRRGSEGARNESPSFLSSVGKRNKKCCLKRSCAEIPRRTQLPQGCGRIRQADSTRACKVIVVLTSLWPSNFYTMRMWQLFSSRLASTVSLIVCDHCRRTFAQFKLCAHLLVFPC